MKMFAMFLIAAVALVMFSATSFADDCKCPANPGAKAALPAGYKAMPAGTGPVIAKPPTAFPAARAVSARKPLRLIAGRILRVPKVLLASRGGCRGA